MSEYTINIEGSTITGSKITNVSTQGSTSRDMEMLDEIEKIISEIKQTEPMIARALQDLQQAIEANNKTKTASLIKDLSTGTVASFLANVASATLLRFLGIR